MTSPRDPRPTTALVRNRLLARPRVLVLTGVIAVALLAATAVTLIAPDAVRQAIFGSDCPRAPAAGAAPAATTTSAAGTTPNGSLPAAPVEDISSVAVSDGRRIPSLWPFTADSPWNVPLGEGAVLSDADDPRIRNLQGGRSAINIDEFSIEILTATDQDPLESVNAINNQAELEMRIPTDAEPSRGSDGNLDVVQPDGVTLWENWITRGGPGQWSAQYSVEVSLTGDGISGGVRAYGGSTAAGLIRRWELEEGEVRHAVALALCSTQLRNGPVWPATIEDGGGTATGDYSGSIPMGTLLAIPPEIDIDSLPLSPAGAAIARAYQRYGGYVTDSAGATIVAFVEPSTPPELRPDRSDASTIRDLLRIVENTDQATPGGPGMRVAPYAPPLAVG